MTGGPGDDVLDGTPGVDVISGLDGGNGTDEECLGADVNDLDGQPDQDAVTNCE